MTVHPAVPLAQLVEVERSRLLSVVWSKAWHANGLAKLLAGRPRANAYRQKARHISWVLERDPAGVVLTELSLLGIGVQYRGGPRLHCPWRRLTPAAQGQVLAMIRERMAGRVQ